MISSGVHLDLCDLHSRKKHLCSNIPCRFTLGSRTSLWLCKYLNYIPDNNKRVCRSKIQSEYHEAFKLFGDTHIIICRDADWCWRVAKNTSFFAARMTRWISRILYFREEIKIVSSIQPRSACLGCSQTLQEPELRLPWHVSGTIRLTFWTQQKPAPTPWPFSTSRAKATRQQTLFDYSSSLYVWNKRIPIGGWLGGLESDNLEREQGYK